MGRIRSRVRSGLRMNPRIKGPEMISALRENLTVRGGYTLCRLLADNEATMANGPTNVTDRIAARVNAATGGNRRGSVIGLFKRDARVIISAGY